MRDSLWDSFAIPRIVEVLNFEYVLRAKNRQTFSYTYILSLFALFERAGRVNVEFLSKRKEKDCPYGLTVQSLKSEKCSKSVTNFWGYLGIHTGAELQTYANTSLCILMWNISINADVSLQRIVHGTF